MFFVTAGGNAVNDLFDAERDAVNKPSRPIPSGRVSKRFAGAISIACFCASLAFGYLVGISMLHLAFVASISLILYPSVLKEYKALGNVLVSALVGLTFIAGSLAAGSWQYGLNLAILASVVNWSREIFKDLEEKTPERWTLSKLVGIANASLTAAGLLFWGILAGISLSLGLSLPKRALFLLAVLAWVLTLLNYRKPIEAQRLIKTGMGLITVALLLPF